jgi:putative DNA primase/helicase
MTENDSSTKPKARRRKTTKPPEKARALAAVPTAAELNADEKFSGVDEEPAKHFNWTDYGNAERLVARHGQDLRYCHEWSVWLVWDGQVWRKDVTGEVMRRAKATVRAMHFEAAEIEDNKTREAFVSFIKRSEAGARLKEMIRLAESEPGIPVTPQEMDADQHLLNCRNGVLDLRNDELLPHDRDLLCTKLAPVDFHPEAPARRWEAFLLRVLPDDDLRAFVQRAVGYSLTGSTVEHVLFLLHGNGANGKSTFIETVRAVLGDYAQNAAPDTFLARRAGGIPNDVARLQGARFVSALETGDGRKLDEAFVKQVTGGDRMTARFMRAEFFEFQPVCKVWFATNHKPQVQGTDDGIWRRLRLVPFDQTIPDAERDKKLAAKLQKELPGVLRWAVDGCQAYREHGLGEAERVAVATAEYRQEMDTFGDFLDAETVEAPGSWIASEALYHTYLDWARDNGIRNPLGQTAFGQRLTARGYVRHRQRVPLPGKGVGSRKAHGWLGLSIPGYAPVRAVDGGK